MLLQYVIMNLILLMEQTIEVPDGMAKTTPVMQLRRVFIFLELMLKEKLPGVSWL